MAVSPLTVNVGPDSVTVDTTVSVSGAPSGEPALELTEANLLPSTFDATSSVSTIGAGTYDRVDFTASEVRPAAGTVFNGCRFRGTVVPTGSGEAYGCSWNTHQLGPVWAAAFNDNAGARDWVIDGCVGYGPKDHGAVRLHSGMVMTGSIMANLNPTASKPGFYHSVMSTNGGPTNVLIEDCRVLLDGPATGHVSNQANWGHITDVVYRRVFFDSGSATNPQWSFDVQMLEVPGGTWKIIGCRYEDCIHGPVMGAQYGGYNVASGVVVVGAHMVDGTPVN